MRSKRDELRSQIDEVDQNIMDLIEYRMDLMDLISIWCQQNYIDFKDPKRAKEVIENYTDTLGSVGVTLSSFVLGLDF